MCIRDRRYTLNDGSERSVFCQNKQLRTADTVYANQLTDGFLEYEMSIVGSDADGVKITSCLLYTSWALILRMRARAT